MRSCASTESVRRSRGRWRRTTRWAGPAARPGLEVDGKTLYAATSADFLRECLDRQAGLDANPQFAAGLAALGPDGNGLTWGSPRFFSRLQEIGPVNPDAAPDLRRALDVFSSNLPTVTQPLFSVRSNLPDGILMRSNWNRSLKPDIAMSGLRDLFQFERMRMPSGRFERTEKSGWVTVGRFELKTSSALLRSGAASGFIEPISLSLEKNRGETHVRPLPSGPRAASPAANWGFASRPACRSRHSRRKSADVAA